MRELERAKQVKIRREKKNRSDKAIGWYRNTIWYEYFTELYIYFKSRRGSRKKNLKYREKRQVIPTFFSFFFVNECPINLPRKFARHTKKRNINDKIPSLEIEWSKKESVVCSRLFLTSFSSIFLVAIWRVRFYADNAFQPKKLKKCIYCRLELNLVWPKEAEMVEMNAKILCFVKTTLTSELRWL